MKLLNQPVYLNAFKKPLQSEPKPQTSTPLTPPRLSKGLGSVYPSGYRPLRFGTTIPTAEQARKHNEAVYYQLYTDTNNSHPTGPFQQWHPDLYNILGTLAKIYPVKSLSGEPKEAQPDFMVHLLPYLNGSPLSTHYQTGYANPAFPEDDAPFWKIFPRWYEAKPDFSSRAEFNFAQRVSNGWKTAADTYRLLVPALMIDAGKLGADYKKSMQQLQESWQQLQKSQKELSEGQKNQDEHDEIQTKYDAIKAKHREIGDAYYAEMDRIAGMVKTAVNVSSKFQDKPEVQAKLPPLELFVHPTGRLGSDGHDSRWTSYADYTFYIPVSAPQEFKHYLNEEIKGKNAKVAENKIYTYVAPKLHQLQGIVARNLDEDIELRSHWLTEKVIPQSVGFGWGVCDKVDSKPAPGSETPFIGAWYPIAKIFDNKSKQNLHHQVNQVLNMFDAMRQRFDSTYFMSDEAEKAKVDPPYELGYRRTDHGGIQFYARVFTLPYKAEERDQYIVQEKSKS